MVKKVTLIAANGKTPREIISRLLEQDDIQLMLFARRPERLRNFDNERAAAKVEMVRKSASPREHGFEFSRPHHHSDDC